MNSGRLSGPDYEPTRRDHADMDCRRLLTACEELERQHNSFTPEQAHDLRAARDTINAMLLRVEQ